ncbi:hypothetical protein [Pseudomonas fluorescens]|uniref:hypothetical protein n=1 Tax=Pseudomonas fluorescens TaxID=294 RepID=UPI003D22F4D5
MDANEVLDVDIVEARCGLSLKAPYLNHPYYSRTSNLCITLHYIFMRYTPTVVAQNGYRLSRAICIFFDYLKEQREITPVALHPSEFSDISIEVLLGYQDYLRRNKMPVSNAEKLKSAFGAVAKQHGTIPLLLFPVIDRPKSFKTEPLGDDAYESLKAALITHINKLYEKLEYRKVVERATAYEYHSIPPNDPDNPLPMRNWDIDHARSLKTLIELGFPMAVPLDSLSENMSRDHIGSYGRDCDTILKALMHKYIMCSAAQGHIKLDKLLDKYYPTSMDQAAIVVFLLLQSGWNKETVIAIDESDFEHILTGSIDEGLAVIFSEKYRSQGLDKPYEAPKTITASSNRDDRYSIYSLIILAKKLSEPLKGHPFDTNPFQKAWEERNPLYLFLRANGDWLKNGSRHSSISVLRAYVIGIEHFLKEYEIIEDGKRLLRAADITKRLRPTWSLHKKRTTPLSMIAAHFGHTSVSTTDVHYDSSGAAMKERRERLRDELEAVVTLLVNRQFSGLLSKKANAQASAQIKFFTLPGKDRPLWGCEDQYTPDWLGHESFVVPGSKCFQLERCIGCKNIRIYEDSLPYLMERLSHIEYELENESKGPRTTDLEWEKDILESLIDDMADEELVKDAARYRRRNAPLLPRDMSSLRLIFEEESANV